MEQQKPPEAFRRVHAQFVKLVQIYLELEKQPRQYGTEELLTSSEIHLIEVIGDHEGLFGVTDLARRANVTKGAVSQSLKRLEAKGLTDKGVDPRNSSRSIVNLTSKGKAAYYAHKHWHEKMDGGYLAYVNDLEEGKLEFLMDFMNRVELFLNSILQR